MMTNLVKVKNIIKVKIILRGVVVAMTFTRKPVKWGRIRDRLRFGFHSLPELPIIPFPGFLFQVEASTQLPQQNKAGMIAS